MVRKNALRLILDKAIKALTGKDRTVEYPGDYYPSYGLEREGTLADFGRVFQAVADFCYTIEQGDLVRQALRGIMQDTKWTSSTELVRIVAYQVARDSVESAYDTWNSWYFAVEPTASNFALTDHRLMQCPPVLTFKFVNEMRVAFEVIQSHLHSNISAFNEWKTNRLEEMLHAIKSHDKSDVPALMQLVPMVNPETYFEM